MRTIFPRAAALALLLAACTGSSPMPDPRVVRQSLMDADRSFAAATAARGLEGWLAAYDSSGIQMEPDVPFTPGIDAVRALMAPAFADSSFHLTWEPTMSFASEAGDLGYTLGTWRSVSRDASGAQMAHTGKYVTIWRRQVDGSWKVVFDGGNPDTALPSGTGSP